MQQDVNRIQHAYVQIKTKLQKLTCNKPHLHSASATRIILQHHTMTAECYTA